MPIVSSTIIEDAAQINGFRWITELHTDQLGLQYRMHYMTAAATNTAPIMAAHAVQIGANLTAQEIASNVAAAIASGSLAVMVYNYSTQAQSDLAIRQAFQFATGVTAINLGDYLRTLTAGRLTVAFSLGNVISLTAALAAIGTQATAMRAAVGQ